MQHCEFTTSGDEIMKALKLVVGAGLMALSMSAVAADTGGGITGTAHDWSASHGTTLAAWLVDPTKPRGATTTYNTGNASGSTPSPASSSRPRCRSASARSATRRTRRSRRTLLWNHTLQATAYKWDVPATTAGTTYPAFQGDTYKGSTTKCLSCHDGLMASTDGMWFNRAMHQRQQVRRRRRLAQHRSRSRGRCRPVEDPPRRDAVSAEWRAQPVQLRHERQLHRVDGMGAGPDGDQQDPPVQRRRRRQYRRRRGCGQERASNARPATTCTTVARTRTSCSLPAC